MADNLVNRLEAMYANDEVLGYLSNRLSGDKLKAGWIETGLVSKGIKGDLVNKENQEGYVIPLSTTIRAVIDRDIKYPDDAGILILGEPGLLCEKFVVVFKNESDDDKLIRNISAFWIKGYTPNEITRLFLKHELGSGLLSTFDEPGVDYIEYLRDQISSGILEEAFSLVIPSNWRKSRNWISDLLKEDSSESMLLIQDWSKNTVSLAYLLSNWIKDMSEQLKIEKLVGACFFIRGNISEGFFWDGPREIMTCSQFNTPDIEQIAMNILLPLWDTSGAPIHSTTSDDDSDIKSKDTIHGESIPPSPPLLPQEFEEIAHRARGLVGKIDIDDTFRRIERIEAILGELEYARDQEDEKTTVPHPDLMESRIKEALDSLEEITNRLEELEKRLVTVCKEIE